MSYSSAFIWLGGALLVMFGLMRVFFGVCGFMIVLYCSSLLNLRWWFLFWCLVLLGLGGGILQGLGCRVWALGCVLIVCFVVGVMWRFGFIKYEEVVLYFECGFYLCLV